TFKSARREQTHQWPGGKVREESEDHGEQYDSQLRFPVPLPTVERIHWLPLPFDPSAEPTDFGPSVFRQQCGFRGGTRLRPNRHDSAGAAPSRTEKRPRTVSGAHLRYRSLQFYPARREKSVTDEPI